MIQKSQALKQFRLKGSRLGAYIKSQPFQHLLIMLIGSVTIMLTFILAISPTRYDLYVGMVPTTTISATRDVADEVTTEQNRLLAAGTVTPTYKFSEGITDIVSTNLDNVYMQYSALRQYAQSLPDYSQNKRYTTEELEYAAQMATLVALRDYQLVTLMNASQSQYDELTASLKAAVRNTMQGHVTQGQEGIAKDSIMQIVGFKTSVSLLQNVVAPTLEAIIQANMVIDQEQTEAAKLAATQAVEPVIYKQGQNIVVRGEGRIKPHQIAMLNSLGLLNNDQIDYRMYWGALLVVLFTLLAMSLVLFFACPNVASNKRRLLMIYSTLIIETLLCFLAKGIQNIYLAPLILSALLLSATVGFLPAIIVNVSASLIGAFILAGANSASNADLISLLVSSLLTGTIAALIVNKKSEHSLILAAGAAAGVVNFITVFALGMMISNVTSNYLDHALLSIGGVAAATLLSLALQPLAEALFNLPTGNRLMELSNPNQPLLRRLLLEAPGTYHHSIIIANLAEASAEAVGANPLLARVGGYYHDIGKLKRPHYFKENQIGIGNIHDSTDPSVSAAIITAHVRDGLALARQYRLPREVQQIVAQHHGNSRVAYFYSKAVKEAGEEVDDENFRYDGVPPQSAEGAIVMLCDTIEAAVRSLSNPTPEDIDAFIWKLIHAKLDDGQLLNAPLTLSDLYAIRKTCSAIVHGIFHERVQYPADDRKSPLERIKSNLKASTKAVSINLDTFTKEKT